MINIAVLDDEHELLAEYQKQIPYLLKKNKIDGELIIATDSPDEFLEKVKSRNINICILDINLRTNTNGMHIAKQIRENDFPCEIIFMTGFLEYTLKAFDVQAFNYIQKPGWDELEKTLVKYKEQNVLRRAKKTVSIKCGSEVYFINCDDIFCIEHVGTKTTVYTSFSEYQTYEGLEELVKRIEDDRFTRIHRSAFINSEFIEKIDFKNKEVSLTNGSTYKIGPKFYDEIKSIIDRR